jgi:hypothetical protein
MRFGRAACIAAASVCIASGAFAQPKVKPSASLSAETVAARQKIFGVENVDAKTGATPKDQVVMSWLTNTTFAVSLLGRVVLLDSYVTRLEVKPGRTPFVIKDMVDLMPEAIMVGHGHFDHSDNAAYIAKKTGATIYASPETCDSMQATVTRMYNDPTGVVGGGKIIDDDHPVNCVPVVSRASAPGSEVAKLDFLEPLTCVIAFKHMHSASVPFDTTWGPAMPFTPNVTRDTRDAQMYPAGSPLTPPSNVANRVPGQMDIRSATAGDLGIGGPISILYQFVVRRGPNYFTLLWHNTSGPLKEGIAPDGNWGPAIGTQVFDLFDRIPRTDVQIGSVSTAGLLTNGMRDVMMYSQHLQPKVFFPGHMTTGTNGVGESSSPEMYWTFKQQKAFMGINDGPEVRWLNDPIDYLRPFVFDPNDARWADPKKDPGVAEFCGK